MSSEDLPRVVVRDQIITTDSDGYHVTLTIDCSTKDGFDRVLGHLGRLTSFPLTDPATRPAVTDSMSREQQLRQALMFDASTRQVSGHSTIFVVLVAMRVGIIKRAVNRWEGGNDLVSRSHGVLAKSEISKAATVIAADISSALDPNTSIEDAMAIAQRWLRDHNWLDSYERLKATRRHA